MASSDSEEAEYTLTGLADAALSRGHEVTLFFSDRSVRLLVPRDDEEDYTEFHSRGSRLLVCRTSVTTSGVPSSGGFIKGVEMSSLGELVDLMDDHDRMIFVGGDDR
ncbi:DsrE family protein [Candidatus Bathyarchaeota archaeon]|nr:DsrE family protein [Candidatus Bathyarchaeota archaeon]MBL7167357.1 DsrE family protein [Candidatus Bathyarchaeota archaeon]